MTLAEALEAISKYRHSESPARVFFLACGCTPLHLRTFLHAHLYRLLPSAPIEIHTGVFGDLPGTLERASSEQVEAFATVIEWSDLDPRLGVRQLGGWGRAVAADAVHTAVNRLRQIDAAIRRIAQSSTVIVSVPTLPLPPCFSGPGWVESRDEAALRAAVGSFVADLANVPHVVILNQQRLQHISPVGDRHDLRGELQTGFPYSQTHAEILANLLARAMVADQRLKGIITDLDETLWKGLLGEIGIESVAWDLDHGAQVHGLYQQVLDMFAESGTLVAVATKNDPALVQDALRRSDLRISERHLFPVEAGWGPKSESVGRILRAWNISADAVAYIDDSPMELAEVKFAHPEIQCLRFPENPADVMGFLETLRDRCSKSEVSLEDGIRAKSLRSLYVMQNALNGASSDAFLEQAKATLTVSFAADTRDTRALELVNKTNQFNLNGKRFTLAEWHAARSVRDCFIMTVSYKDKFGPLGKIAVLAGTKDVPKGVVRVTTWVMSCRAFSRRIEYACLRQLFETYHAFTVVLEYEETPRNGPIRQFLAQFGDLHGEFRLSRAQFDAKCPALYHVCEEATIG